MTRSALNSAMAARCYHEAVAPVELRGFRALGDATGGLRPRAAAKRRKRFALAGSATLPAAMPSTERR